MVSIYRSARLDHDKLWGVAGVFLPIAAVQQIMECYKKGFSQTNDASKNTSLIGRVKPATAWQHLARAVILTLPLIGSLSLLIYDRSADLDFNRRLFAGGTNLEILEKNLNQWIQEGDALENRKRAANEILKVYHSKGSFLGITSCGLTSLPPEIGLLTHLTSLSLHSNRLTSLPSEIGQLINLDWLFLTNNQLTSLPPEFRQLIYVEKLSLADNQFISLPNEIGNLSSLRELDLSENKMLVSLPSSLGQLLCLERIDGKNANEKLEEQIENILNECRFHRSPPYLESSPISQENSELSFSANDQARKKMIEGLLRWIVKRNHLDVLGKGRIEIDQRHLMARIEAAKKIFKAYEEKSAELNLSFLECGSLPSEIGELKSLQKLNLQGTLLESLPTELAQLKMLTELELASNWLKSFPEEILELTDLQYLGLYHNRLSIIPEGIGRLTKLTELSLMNNSFSLLPATIGNLINLKSFWISENYLNTLPDEIGCLIQLKDLGVGKNRLQRLPEQIGRLICLEHLNLEGNPELNELPMSLGEIPTLVTLHSPNSHMYEICRSLNRVGNSKRAENLTPESLLNRLNIWAQSAKMEPFNRKFVDFFSSLERSSINEWLVRLAVTPDFRSYQTKLAQHVCEMLMTLEQNEEFKNSFFSLVNVNLEACEDRIAMAFNEIYTEWIIATLPSDSSLEDKLEILSKGAKTFALRVAIAKKIEEHEKITNRAEREAVEIYLYYETHLQNILLTAIKTSKYAEACGNRSWIQVEELQAEIEKNYIERLVNFPIFKQLFYEDPAIQQLLNDKQAALSEELENLGNQNEGLYLEMSEDLVKRFDLFKLDLARDWVKNKLSRNVFSSSGSV